MKKQKIAVWLVGCLLCLAAGAAQAQADLPKRKPLGENKYEKQKQAIIALKNEVADLNARYWANRIVNEKDVTLEEIRTYSQKWVGDGPQQYRQIEAVVKSGTVRPLTPEEHRRLDENRLKVRAVLNPERQDKKLMASLTQQECAELEARMWAYRALYDSEKWYKPGWEDGLLLPEKYRLESGDLVENLPRNIERKKEVRRLFLQYMKNKNPQPLSDTERSRLNGCSYFDDQVYSITRYPAYEFTGDAK